MNIKEVMNQNKIRTKMKTTTKQITILKRTFAIIFLSVLIITGIYSQKSMGQGIFINTNHFRKSLPDLLDDWSKNSDCINYIIIGTKHQNITEEAIDEEMKIEDWMLNEFNINTGKEGLLKDDVVKEEEMEIEDWMLNVSHWLVANK